jgi:hypothetical protein
MATANLILAEYVNKPDEFERIFGFPLCTCEADGSIHLNYERLAVSIYYQCGKDGRDGKEPSGIFPKDAIESYLSEHNINVVVNRESDFPSIKRIIDDLGNGPVPLSLNPCIMYDEMTGAKIEVGAHAIIITGVTEDGYLIVSSWEKQFVVHQSDYENIKREDGEYVVYDSTTFQ